MSIQSFETFPLFIPNLNRIAILSLKQRLQMNTICYTYFDSLICRSCLKAMIGQNKSTPNRSFMSTQRQYRKHMNCHSYPLTTLTRKVSICLLILTIFLLLSLPIPYNTGAVPRTRNKLVSFIHLYIANCVAVSFTFS